MFCTSCGNKLQDDAMFCTACGTPVAAVQKESYAPNVQEQPAASAPNVQEQPAASAPNAQEQPAASAPNVQEQSTVSAPNAQEQPAASAPNVQEQPAWTYSAVPNAAPPAGKRKKKGLLFLIIGIAAVVLIALITAAALLFLNIDPKLTVGKAFIKSYGEYTAVQEKLTLPDWQLFRESREFSQSLSVQFEEIPDGAELEGFGLRVDSDITIPDQKAHFDVAAFYGSADLLSGKISLDDANLYLGCDALLGDQYLGLNTETIGADLSRLGLTTEEDDKRIGFNFFEILELLEKHFVPSHVTPEDLSESVMTLAEAITVEKQGKSSVNVNGVSTKCREYTVLIPQDAMENFADVLADEIADKINFVDQEQFMEELLTALGLPEEYVSASVGSITYDAIEPDELFTDITETVLDAVGDLEFAVHIKDGYIMAVEYDNEIEDVQVTLGIYLGGGDHYIDDFSLVLEADDDSDRISLELTSNGDHTASEGIYTDETSLTFRENGSKIMSAESLFSYSPNESEDNFSWTLNSDEIEIKVEIEGQVAVEKNSLSLDLDTLEFTTSGETLGVELAYSLRPYEDPGITVTEPLMLSDIELWDLLTLAGSIESNVDSWATDLQQQFPDLMYLFS